MKKILLIAAIFGFQFSNAQKKIYLYPQRPMKKFQSYHPLNKQPKMDFQQKWNNGLKDLSKPLPQAKLLYTLKDNTEVFLLPQDNMICLVPDMKQFNMPNLVSPYNSSIIPEELKNKLQRLPGRIPNPAIPFIIPQRKDMPTQ